MKKLWIVMVILSFLLILQVSVAVSQTAQDFVPLLINLSGWEGSEPETVELAIQDMKGIVVSRDYSKGDQSLKAGIMVGQQTTGMWNSTYQEGFKMEAGSNLMEVKKQDGYIIMHTYNGDEKEGMYIVLLQEVSPDGSSGALFVFSYEGMDDSEGQKLAGKFDWGAMKSKL
ncbi:MAG: hypothetical protein JSV25_10260 [Spirochaetota bacterium]|nr:MAG: hypothetical protein JSV25_10260 [Spirochaetota bacterium]